jgi:hypothetical protein
VSKPDPSSGKPIKLNLTRENPSRLETRRASSTTLTAPDPLLQQHFRWMLQRAIDAGVPFAWVTADEAYGQVKHLRVWLEQRGVGYVLATKVNDTVITTGWREARADELVARLPRQAWKRLSGGKGSHGERVYDWARVAIRPAWEDGVGHWVLARRSVKDPPTSPTTSATAPSPPA